MSNCAYEIKQAVDEALGRERLANITPRLLDLQRGLRHLHWFGEEPPCGRVELRVTGTSAELVKVRIDSGRDADWKLKPLERRLKKAAWPSGKGNLEDPAPAGVKAALTQLAKLHEQAIRSRNALEVTVRFEPGGQVQVVTSPRKVGNR